MPITFKQIKAEFDAALMEETYLAATCGPEPIPDLIVYCGTETMNKNHPLAATSKVLKRATKVKKPIKKPIKESRPTKGKR